MMKQCILLICMISILSCKNTPTETTKHASINTSETSQAKPDFAMVIHGGAGTILKENMSDEKEKVYLDALNLALSTGEAILKNGGSSMDAVVETIKTMENSPLFNAGKGAVFTHDGHNELDASLMRGSDLEAGAIGGVRTIKHPIEAARGVLEKSEHVFMVGEGADKFGASLGLETVDNVYFKTERRWNSLQKILEKEKAMGAQFTQEPDSKYGTVGAVALDKKGNIVAGTSTGGMTNKRYNRIGDSPVIGAGTYANDKTCGVSCTGHGEYFIRYAVAHDVSAMMEYKEVSVDEAADNIINTKLKDAGGSGGLIALDKDGNISMPFNTAGMYRGYVTDSKRFTAIYKEE